MMQQNVKFKGDCKENDPLLQTSKADNNKK